MYLRNYESHLSTKRSKYVGLSRFWGRGVTVHIHRPCLFWPTQRSPKVHKNENTHCPDFSLWHFTGGGGHYDTNWWLAVEIKHVLRKHQPSLGHRDRMTICII